MEFCSDIIKSSLTNLLRFLIHDFRLIHDLWMFLTIAYNLLQLITVQILQLGMVFLKQIVYKGIYLNFSIWSTGLLNYLLGLIFILLRLVTCEFRLNKNYKKKSSFLSNASKLLK